MRVINTYIYTFHLLHACICCDVVLLSECINVITAAPAAAAAPAGGAAPAAGKKEEKKEEKEIEGMGEVHLWHFGLLIQIHQLL